MDYRPTYGRSFRDASIWQIKIAIRVFNVNITDPLRTHEEIEPGHGGCAAINPRYRMSGYWYPNHVRWLTAQKRRDERRKAIEERDKEC